MDSEAKTVYVTYVNVGTEDNPKWRIYRDNGIVQTNIPKKDIIFGKILFFLHNKIPFYLRKIFRK